MRPYGKIVTWTLAGALTAAAAPALEPEDLLGRRWIDAPSLSPDGRQVAYAVTESRVEPEVSDEATQVWLSAVDGSGHRQLTRGGDDAFDPSWSPRGDLLAFRSARGGDVVQLWLIRPDGGEAWRLTAGDEDVGPYRWSPDGREIAFLRADPQSEARRQAEKAKDDARVVDRDFRYRHLYRVAAAAAPARDLPEPRRVTAGTFHVETFDWSPDGRRFVLTHHPTPRIFEWRSSDLSTVAAGGGELVPLVRHAGMDTAPLFSPDGTAVAFVSDRGHRTWARDWRICLVPAAGGEVTVLAPTYDGMPGEFIDGELVAWAGDGSGVYYAELQGTSIQLFFLPADGGAYRRITAQPGVKWGFDLAAGLMAYVGEDFERPQEVWVEALSGGEARAVTSINGGLPPLPAARSEEVRWKSFDGLEIEGILHLPPGYEKSRRLPLIVNLHGGPTWAFLREYALPLRLMAERGFAVLQVNPRGSTGYGREFRLANLGDWGGADVGDVLAGVDHVVALGVADPERLGVFGASYGGFLTGMTISKSRRFKAAIVEAGPSHLVSIAGTMDITGFIPSFLESEFWEAEDLWRDRSAVYHADEITTPTLILHGEDDERVPVGQAYELYRALERAGVPTEMVVYPRTGHGFREPKLWLDLARRELEWFERWLLGDS